MPPVPENEAARIAELYSYSILDSAPEEACDDIVVRAQSIFGTQASLISLVDKERQWFKARRGLDVSETSRDVSFCAHTILTDVPMVVNDATLDPRFADNPLVTDAPHIRFYAGAPIRTHAGFNIGSLCIIDNEPRIHFPEADQDRLTGLAALVADQLFQRRESDRRQRKRYRTDLTGVIKAYQHPIVEVQIYDISEGGAMLKCTQAPPNRGEEVTLLTGEVVLVATIAWRKDNVCGISFHRHLPRPLIDSLHKGAAA